MKAVNGVEANRGTQTYFQEKIEEEWNITWRGNENETGRGEDNGNGTGEGKGE